MLVRYAMHRRPAPAPPRGPPAPPPTRPPRRRRNDSRARAVRRGRPAAARGTRRRRTAAAGPARRIVRRGRGVQRAWCSRILTAGGTEARVWDARTFRPLTDSLKYGPGQPVALAALDPAGRLVLTAAGGEAWVWDSS